MELQGRHKSVHISPFGGEKEQMLNLNQRLESYLNRVKLLEGENAMLAKEIQHLRRNHHGDLERRKLLDEELRNARQQVDKIWKERVFAEVDVARLTEEFETLDLQLQRESQAQIEANIKADRSRKDLEEERRAQIWLREKVSQLEYEMKALIQTHQEEVANMEAMLMESRATTQLAMRPVQQSPNLLDLGQEYTQRASKAWQEAAEAYQDQLSRLEESVNEAKKKLTQANKEKGESVVKLQSMDREMLGLREVRGHLEETAAQQKESHSQDVQMLQEHLEALEREKHTLGDQMDHLLLENRGLVQMKMSLNMEVATYRALLDSESHKGDISLQKQPRNVYVKDAVFSPWGFKENYQLSPCPKTTSLSSACSVPGNSKPPAITATPILYQKLVPRKEILEISKEKVQDNAVHKQPEIESTPYPKVLKDGAVENFRPQEVLEKVTYAEPLSPQNEEEDLKTLEMENGWNDTVDQPSEETPAEKSGVSSPVEPSLNSEIPFNKASPLLVESELIEESCSFSIKSEPLEMQFEKEEMEKPQAPIDAWVEMDSIENTEVGHEEQPCVKSDVSYQIESIVKPALTEELYSFPVTSEPIEMPFEKEETEKPLAPVDAWVERDATADTDVAHEQEESSDSETEAVVETNFDTKSSSPASESELVESMTHQLMDIVKEDFSYDGLAVASQDVSPPKDKLYPDGEEMDTWDSVIEKNPVMTTDITEPKEVMRQHAEPEEDISVREAQKQKQEMIQDVEREANMASSTVETQINDDEQNTSMKEELPDKSQEEDSQNVEVSWRTELEGDSYAQDNTLADTRPLIRYKSDETDANTQASHVDDGDSSDSDEEKKVGEIESGAWGEDKTRRFGTMEDLCEEAEGEVLDEEYDLDYLQKQVREDDAENDDNEKETQENYEELDTDKLVEQELENLSTDCYSTIFAQANSNDTILHQTLQEMTEAEEKTEDITCLETIDKDTSSTSEDQKMNFNDAPFEGPHSDIVVQEVQETVEAVEEEDKHNISMLTHCDTTEDITEIRKSLVWSSASQELEGLSFENLSFESKENDKPEEVEEEQYVVKGLLTESHPNTDFSKDDVNQFEKSTLFHQVLPDNGFELRDKTPEEIFVPEEASAESPEVPLTTEWDVLENEKENVADDKFDSEHAQKCLLGDDKVEHDSFSPIEEPENMSPETVHDEGDMFIVKDSSELLKTNGKANLDDLFSISANNDFWASPLETGATYQPDDVETKHAEWNLGFGDVASRGSEHSVEKSAIAFGAEQKDVSQILSRSGIKGEIVHSEESEDDSDALSSGEE